MKWLKRLGIALGVLLAAVFGLVLFVVLSDYRPEAVEEHAARIAGSGTLPDEFTVVTFNIGYCGLDEGQDFFMDGGTGSRSSSEAQTRENLDANVETVRGLDADIVLLQEVDIDSTRSFRLDQRAAFEAIPGYGSAFAMNYRVPWVPIPLSLPMGRTESGLLTLVRGEILQATRFALPNDPTIPDRYFLLDRCLDEIMIPMVNGETLRLVNLHLSAYDSGGVIKAQQMQWLRDYLTQTAADSEYIILGGDWNQLLARDIVIDRDAYNPEWLGQPPTLFDDLPFQWAYDSTVNTVRDLYEAYVPGQTFETVIDGFLVSDTLEILAVETVDLEFAHSDHHPVKLTVRIR